MRLADGRWDRLSETKAPRGGCSFDLEILACHARHESVGEVSTSGLYPAALSLHGTLARGASGADRSGATASDRAYNASTGDTAVRAAAASRVAEDCFRAKGYYSPER
jgi:hypothetical protein